MSTKYYYHGCALKLKKKIFILHTLSQSLKQLCKGGRLENIASVTDETEASCTYPRYKYT